jgi:D-sedoheptulose 7-phosphate isomerase
MNQISSYISSLQATMNGLSVQAIARVVDILREARVAGRQVFIMGNGGSASTASHFVCDLAKNTRRRDLPHFRVIGLNDNMPMFSALANDEGYEAVFAAQLNNLINPGDVVIGISASGKSKNVLNAMGLAKERGAVTIGFTGFDGGLLRTMVDAGVHVDSRVIEHVEDIHLMLEHMIVQALKDVPADVIKASNLQEKSLEV